MIKTVDFALGKNAPVVVVTPPFVSARHQRQQESLAAALRARYGRDSRFSYVAIGSSADVHNPVMSADGVNLNDGRIRGGRRPHGRRDVRRDSSAMSGERQAPRRPESRAIVRPLGRRRADRDCRAAAVERQDRRARKSSGSSAPFWCWAERWRRRC